MESRLEDVNSALAKFVEDQTVHGFIPIPSRRHWRYYRTSSSPFPGPYSIPPGLALITLERVSETKKHSVSLSHSQVSSLETLLSSVCEVTSWLDWWLSTCGGFQEHLSGEVRANFEQLMLSGSRALEFLGCQGVAALGNLMLSPWVSLLLDIRSTVPIEEVARLRCAPLLSSALIFPSPLLKMRTASNDALVQKTLHPPQIPKKSSRCRVKPHLLLCLLLTVGATLLLFLGFSNLRSHPLLRLPPLGGVRIRVKLFSQATDRSGRSGGKRKGSGRRSA